MFDPYLQWLKIPPGQRPPTYYELLEVSPAEAGDPIAVHNAAERRADQLLKYTSGPNAEDCVRIAAEIEAACKTLLDPALRRRYDTALDQPQEAAPAKRAKTPRRANPSAPISPSAVATRNSKSRRRWFLPVAAGISFFFVLVGGTLGYFMGQPQKAPEKPAEQVVSAVPVPLTAAPVDEELLKSVYQRPKASAPPTPAVAVAPAPVKVQQRLPAEPKVVKLPMPDDVAQQTAEEKLKQSYATDYQLLRTADDRLALAAKFLQPGREDRRDPASWFVLLREARDLAARAERPRLAVEAINEIDKWFTIDAVEMTLTTLAAMLVPAASNKTPLASEARAKTFVSVALGRVSSALKADNYEAAKRFIALAEQVLSRSRPDKKIADSIATKREELLKYQSDYRAGEAARNRLREAPDDPAANQAVGLHLACELGKWDEGLPLLARGSDPALKKAAQADLDRPVNPTAQLEIATFWWNYARRYGGRGESEEQQRAAYWYSKAAERLPDGDQRELTRDRLEEFRLLQAGGGTRLTPGGFQCRDVENRILLLRENGGTMQTEEAVERGLLWLAAHQCLNGSWGTDTFYRAAGCNCTDPGRQHDIAGTAFGLLPLLAAGNTHRQGKYRRSVEAGLNFLIQQQFPEGNWGYSKEFEHYEVALATLALTEAYGMTRDPTLEIPAARAVNYIVTSQSPFGGWGYVRRSLTPDTSLTLWQIVALKTAVHAGIYVPKDTFDPMANYLDRAADRDTPGYWYKPPGSDPKEKQNGPRPSLMPDGMLCRELLGWASEKRGLARSVHALLEVPVDHEKSWPGLYYLMFSRSALYHYGGWEWAEWDSRTRDAIVALQDKGGEFTREHRRGSWSPVGEPWMQEGGRLMSTSMALMALEVYYSKVSINGFGPAALND